MTTNTSTVNTVLYNSDLIKTRVRNVMRFRADRSRKSSIRLTAIPPVVPMTNPFTNGTTLANPSPITGYRRPSADPLAVIQSACCHFPAAKAVVLWGRVFGRLYPVRVFVDDSMQAKLANPPLPGGMVLRNWREAILRNPAAGSCNERR